MYYFADDVGTPILKTIEGAEQSSKLLFYGLIIFIISMVSLAIIMFVLRKKFVKTKTKDWVDLP